MLGTSHLLFGRLKTSDVKIDTVVTTDSSSVSQFVEFDANFTADMLFYVSRRPKAQQLLPPTFLFFLSSFEQAFSPHAVAVV